MKERTSKTSISRILIIFILPALFLFGCGDSDDSDDCTKVDIPTVTFSCDAATDCSDNSADDNGGDFIVYFIENGGICGATGIPTAITYAIGYVILTAGNCSNGTCTISSPISSWVDPSQTPITQICKGSYRICAKIDTDNSGDYESGEPYVGIDLEITGGGTLTLDSGWNDIP